MSNSQEGATALQVGRIGLIGAVIGALIGGLGSFSGAYLTYRQQRDTYAADVKRSAYVTLVTKSQIFISTLKRLDEAGRRQDIATYVKERDQLRTSAHADVSAAIAAVYVTGDVGVTKKAVEIGAAIVDYGKYAPPSVDGYDHRGMEMIYDKAVAAMGAFQQEARKDVLSS